MWWIALVIGLCVFAWSSWKQFRNEPSSTVAWKRIDSVPFSAAVLRRAAEECFGKGDRESIPPYGTVDMFLRGDKRITVVRAPASVRWLDIPMVFSVGIAVVNGETLLSMRLDLVQGVVLSKQAMSYYERHAVAEIDRAFETLLACAGRDRHDSSSRDSKRGRGSGQVGEVARDDYALLNLRPGATWAEVQSAFRTISMQFHPDRMVGLPESIIELGTRRFNEASGAYQRLREQLGSQA